jgi:DNA-binding SARP family transcriptional activator
MEDLWPETSPKEGKRKFKNNLHRLRKTLEPRQDKTFGSSYLHLQGKLLSLDLELCEVDFQGFLSCYREGICQEEQGHVREALSSYDEAMTRYTGEFLAHESYATWAAQPQEQMHQAYCDLLARKAELLEKQGALVKATNVLQKLIQVDPLLESSYRKLMLLQARRGRYSEALRTYDKCRRALRDGLEVDPDELTTAIYRKIRESSESS